MVRPVDLVNQQYGSIRVAKRAQQGALDQEPICVDVDVGLLRLADREKLALIVPFIEGVLGVDPFIALQSDEVAAEDRGDSLCGLRLADARHAFEQEGLAQPGRSRFRRTISVSI